MGTLTSTWEYIDGCSYTGCNRCVYFLSDELAIDYQFTFNLSKPDDRHFTGINFKNTPTKADVDVDFQVTCSVPSKVSAWSQS